MKAIRTLLSAIFMFMVVNHTAIAQDACPCVPLTHLWVVESCADWNCASSAVILANGDPYTIAMPTSSEEHRWVVVRRIVSGSSTDSGNGAYQLESFDGSSDGYARFAAIESNYRPLMMTTPDGKTIVLSLRQAEPKRRGVRH